ncbi:MAG: tRNA 2-thiocytidine(32) synthetase TtcA [Proteobacteria bacterium]|nr:tRNA 2-thiocytidine(32) synthetase TtcA [Pseudomonadota bacterium]
MSVIEKKLLRQVAQASGEFGLIEPNDRIMVCMSGGKDSYAMLHILQGLSKRTPFHFELIAVNLDQGHPGFPAEVLEAHFKAVDVPYRMLKEDTHSIVLEKIPAGKTFCSLCSRLRRGILYNAAVEMGCTKIALGHHKDDLLETLMMNMLYSGVMKTMPPKLHSDDGRNVVIRPLVYCDESDIAALSEELSFPIIPCDLCGSQENLNRKKMKRLLSDLNAENPHIKGNLFNSMRNIRPSHLLDPSLGAKAPLISEDPDAQMARP